MKRELTLELLEGARNLARCASVRKGDNVLVLVGKKHEDPLLLTALEIVLEEMGATCLIMKGKEFPWREKEPPKPMEYAIYNADVVIGQSQGINVNHKGHVGMVAYKELGVTFISSEITTAEDLASEYGRFPSELLDIIGKKTMEIVCEGKTLRVTTSKGTDISMGINPRHIGGSLPTLRRPGTKKPFPGGVFGIHPEDPANGLICAEAIFPPLNPPSVDLSEPLKITIEDHWATTIEGPHADWFKKVWLEERGDENSRWLGECMWGYNPKASSGGRRTARSDALHFALGMALGGAKYSKTHCDFYVFNPTVYIDGKKLIDNGYLTLYADPEIREVAKKYGDPEQLLYLPPLPLNYYGR